MDALISAVSLRWKWKRGQGESYVFTMAFRAVTRILSLCGGSSYTSPSQVRLTTGSRLVSLSAKRVMTAENMSCKKYGSPLHSC